MTYADYNFDIPRNTFKESKEFYANLPGQKDFGTQAQAQTKMIQAEAVDKLIIEAQQQSQTLPKEEREALIQQLEKLKEEKLAEPTETNMSFENLANQVQEISINNRQTSINEMQTAAKEGDLRMFTVLGGISREDNIDGFNEFA